MYVKMDNIIESEKKIMERLDEIEGKKIGMGKTSSEKLIKNIVDQIKEAQIKLGYVKETVRLYYPLASLNRLLGTDIKTEKEMVKELKNKDSIRNNYNQESLKKLGFKAHKTKIEISVMPEYVEYIHKNVENPKFLEDIIKLFQDNHDCDLKDICAVFEKYSNDYVCEKMPQNAEFDYGIYFKDEKIDEYCYCVKREMGHTIYHRFTRDDYEQIK